MTDVITCGLVSSSKSYSYDDKIEKDPKKMSVREAEAIEDMYERSKTPVEGRIFAIIKSGQRAHLQFFLSRYPARSYERNPNDGSTPLMWAVRGKDLVMVKMLLDKGASVNATDKAGSSALMIACASQNYDVACELAKAGANPFEVHPILNASVLDTPLVTVPKHEKDRIVRAYYSRSLLSLLLPDIILCGLV